MSDIAIFTTFDLIVMALIAGAPGLLLGAAAEAGSYEDVSDERKHKRRPGMTGRPGR